MVKANCNASPAAGHVASNGTTGKIRKSHGPEYAEMQLYLSKLKELVPHVPKNKKVSKLEVIQHVIDYICDLQWALESHPAMRGASSAVHLPMMESADSEDLDDEGRQLQQQLAAAAAAATAVCLHSHSEMAISHSSSSNPHTHTRTPLGVLPPTQNLTAVPSSPMPRSESKA